MIKPHFISAWMRNSRSRPLNVSFALKIHSDKYGCNGANLNIEIVEMIRGNIIASIA